MVKGGVFFFFLIDASGRVFVYLNDLQELGYLCEFSEADLLVSLPLKLRCELLPPPGGQRHLHSGLFYNLTCKKSFQVLEMMNTYRKRMHI